MRVGVLGEPQGTLAQSGHLGLCRQSPLPLLRSRASSALAAQDPVAMEIRKAPLRALEAWACPQRGLKLVVGRGAQLGSRGFC